MRCIILLFVIIYYLETAIATLIKLEGTVDLTWPFDNDTVYWTNTQQFVFTKKVATVTVDGVWYASNEFCAGEHGGTHFDAPYHFNRYGWKVGEIPLERLIAQGVLIDLSDEAEWFHGQARLLPEHLLEWENEHGTIPKNSVILIHFGWSKYYYNRTEYLGMDDNKNLNFPGVSRAAAEWIVRSGNVVGVGVDTASVDPGRDTSFTAHRILSANQIYVLENVKIPPVFPEEGFLVYVMPMKILEGSGAPLRIVAVPLSKGFVPPHLAASTVQWYGNVIAIASSIVLFLLYH